MKLKFALVVNMSSTIFLILCCLLGQPIASQAASSSVEDELFNLPASIAMAKQCNNIITPQGTLGPWGKFLETELTPEKYPILFSGELRDLNSYCPDFKNMSLSAQKEFWVYLVADVAFGESSCNPSSETRGVGGNTAAGLLQMALNKEADWGCPRNMSATNPDQNLNCGLKIMVEDFERNDVIFASPRMDHYFQTLETGSNGLKIRKRLLDYKPCHDTSPQQPAEPEEQSPPPTEVQPEPQQSSAPAETLLDKFEQKMEQISRDL